jgi:hypothetical protein
MRRSTNSNARIFPLVAAPQPPLALPSRVASTVLGPIGVSAPQR